MKLEIRRLLSGGPTWKPTDTNLLDAQNGPMANLGPDVVKVYGFTGEAPTWQIVKERRATFAATPEQVAKRPKAATRWRNLALAGDWTDTGLPATIEGAIRSGHKAAELILPLMT